MAKYICMVCRYVYDEDKGIPEKGIPAGTKWEDLPDDWVCPVCGSPKEEFEPLDDDSSAPAAAPTKTAPKASKTGGLGGTVSIPNGYDDDMREISYAEAAVLCSNLAMGCEKQYLPEEAAAFRKISEFYMSKAAPIEGTFDDLLNLVNETLATNAEALKTSIDEVDHGANRAAFWNDGVTRMLKGILARYGKDGAAMLDGTKIFVCDICGFIYIGDAPPAVCPVCKVPSLKIFEVKRD